MKNLLRTETEKEERKIIAVFCTIALVLQNKLTVATVESVVTTAYELSDLILKEAKNS